MNYLESIKNISVKFLKGIGSVLFLLALLCVLLHAIISFSELYRNHQTKHRYSSKVDIEKEIGIDFPDYKEVRRVMEGSNTYGSSYEVNVTLELIANTNLTAFYKKFDNLSCVAPDLYSTTGNEYFFGFIDYPNRFIFYIEIDKLKNTAIITYKGQGGQKHFNN